MSKINFGKYKLVHDLFVGDENLVRDVFLTRRNNKIRIFNDIAKETFLGIISGFYLIN